MACVRFATGARRLRAMRDPRASAPFHVTLSKRAKDANHFSLAPFFLNVVSYEQICSSFPLSAMRVSELGEIWCYYVKTEFFSFVFFFYFYFFFFCCFFFSLFFFFFFFLLLFLLLLFLFLLLFLLLSFFFFSFSSSPLMDIL